MILFYTGDQPRQQTIHDELPSRRIRWRRMLSHKEWLVLLTGMKGWGAWSVAPLFVTALFLGVKRAGARGWLPLVWIMILLVFGFFFWAAMMLTKDLLRPEMTTYPETKIAATGAMITHLACAYLIVRGQIRDKGCHSQRRGFDILPAPTHR